MARFPVNRSADMEAFVRVVEHGSFSAAARALLVTPSAVSKLITRVEARLGVRLLHRSTRKIQLTPEGEIFFDRSVRLLEEIDAAEREVARSAEPRGRLRVNCNVPFGLHCLLPLVPGFLAKYKHLTVDVVLTDTVVDPIAVRADVAIRTGPLRSSALVARKLGQSRMVVVASPDYLRRRGEPRTPGDLEKHNRLAFGFSRHIRGWPFGAGKRAIVLPPIGNALVSDGEAMRTLALAGLGVARLARFHVAADIKAGRLLPILEKYNPNDTEAIHMVLIGPRNHLPARVRAFMDYLTENLTLSENAV